jgi:hypothetical protein
MWMMRNAAMIGGRSNWSGSPSMVRNGSVGMVVVWWSDRQRSCDRAE